MSPDQIHTQTLTRLCALAAEQVSLDPSTVTPDSDFFNDLNFDSLDTVEFVMKVEDEFAVSIEDHQTERVRTPRQACEMLAAALAAHAPPPNA
jgi:acyl carrier protein